MTVIAAVRTPDGGAVVAADSLVRKDSGEKFHTRKLLRLRGGRIAAAAGDDEAVQLFLDWMRHGGDVKARPYMRRAWVWEGMLITREGIFDFGGSSPFPDQVDKPWHAIGAGADAAMAVLAYQASHLLPLDPKTAVRAVCDVHADCGGPVHTMTVKGTK